MLYILRITVRIARRYGSRSPVLDSPSYLVMDPDTQKVIYGKQIDAIRAPASTTKIMTVLLALEYGKPTDVVTISHRADCEGSTSVGICEGEKIPCMLFAKRPSCIAATMGLLL